MQLLLLIIHDPKQMETILMRMMEAGIRGGSLVDCEGVLQAIGASRGEKPPVFGSLRQYLNPDSDRKNKMLLSAMSAEEIRKTHEIVEEVTGGLQKANTGIFLSLPIGFSDGVR